jgi:hypothetical protein
MIYGTFELLCLKKKNRKRKLMPTFYLKCRAEKTCTGCTGVEPLKSVHAPHSISLRVIVFHTMYMALHKSLTIY